MAKIPATNNYKFSHDSATWSHLQNAIAATSGFRRWQLESNPQLKELRLEQQVQTYLRETLETLAY